MKGTQYSHDPTTGEILSIVAGNLVSTSSNHRGVIVNVDDLVSINPDKHYHNDGAIVDRPVVTTPDEATVAEVVSIAGVPSGVDVVIDGEVVGVSDGTSVELTFDLDGEYEIEIVPPFPFIPLKKILKVVL